MAVSQRMLLYFKYSKLLSKTILNTGTKYVVVLQIDPNYLEISLQEFLSLVLTLKTTCFLNLFYLC